MENHTATIPVTRSNVLTPAVQGEWKDIQRKEAEFADLAQSRKRLIAVLGSLLTVLLLGSGTAMVANGAFSIIPDRAAGEHIVSMVITTALIWLVVSSVATLALWSWGERMFDRWQKKHRNELVEDLRRWWLSVDEDIKIAGMGGILVRNGYAGPTGSFGRRGHLTVTETNGQVWLMDRNGDPVTLGGLD